MTMPLVPEYSAVPLEFTVVKLEGKTYPDRPEEHSEVSTMVCQPIDKQPGGHPRLV